MRFIFGHFEQYREDLSTRSALSTRADILERVCSRLEVEAFGGTGTVVCCRSQGVWGT